MRMERFEEADSLYREAIAIGTRVLDADDPELALWRQNYAGYLCYVANEPRRGIELLREAIPPLRRVYGPESVNEAVAASLLGYCLTSAGEYVEAEQQLQRALPVLESRLGADHRRTGDARDRLARLNEMRERPER
jgi:tetratricopeptide (TPR) repeat protein